MAQEWSPSGAVQLSGELSVELDGASAVSCDYDEVVTAYDSILHSDFVIDYDVCGSRWFGWEFMVVTPFDGATVEFNTGIGESPHGSFDPTMTGPFQGVVVNGSATTPTQIVFDDAVVGRRLGAWGEVSISGALDVTTPAGGLVTYE